MGKFIIVVIIIYVIYYATNIIYDGFLKKTNVNDNNEGDEFTIEDEEQPKYITVADVEDKKDQKKASTVGERERLSMDEITIINGKVDDQGLSINDFTSEIGKQLLGESKQMFAGVNF